MSSPLRHLPNLLSAARMLLVGPIVWSLLQQQFQLAIGLFVVAGVSDAVDGFLAKRFGWTSRLGGILDALADKLLLVSTFLALWWLDVFPGWLVVLIFARDLLIVLASIAYNARIEQLTPQPSMISKLNTLLQIVLAALGVVHLGLLPLPEWLLTGLIYAVMLTVLASGIDYAVSWGKRAISLGGGRGKHH